MSPSRPSCDIACCTACPVPSCSACSTQSTAACANAARTFSAPWPCTTTVLRGLSARAASSTCASSDRAITEALDPHLTPEPIAKELEYFRGPAGRTFERPYGWAWLLELQAEALAAKSRWSRALAPLATELAQRFADYLRISPYPVRAGAHGNTAFACALALDYARAAADAALEFEIRKAARRWYGADRDAPIAYEPSLDDFLSPSLMEAVLMSQILEAGEFHAWLQ